MIRQSDVHAVVMLRVVRSYTHGLFFGVVGNTHGFIFKVHAVNDIYSYGHGWWLKHSLLFPLLVSTTWYVWS